MTDFRYAFHIKDVMVLSCHQGSKKQQRKPFINLFFIQHYRFNHNILSVENMNRNKWVVIKYYAELELLFSHN